MRLQYLRRIWKVNSIISNTNSMKIDKSKLMISPDTLDILADHLNYSIADINSYDELTDSEKEIIPREWFESVAEK